MTSKQILKPVAATAAAIGSAAAIWFAGAGTAVAPEPARLDGNLYRADSWAPAIYIEADTRTYAFYVSKEWTQAYYATSMAPGAPCTSYPASAGTILTGVIRKSGSWARCAQY